MQMDMNTLSKGLILGFVLLAGMMYDLAAGEGEKPGPPNAKGTIDNDKKKEGKTPDVLYKLDIDNKSEDICIFSEMTPDPHRKNKRYATGFQKEIDQKRYMCHAIGEIIDGERSKSYLIFFCARRVNDRTIEIRYENKEPFGLNVFSSESLRKAGIEDAGNCSGVYMRKTAENIVFRDCKTGKEMAIPDIIEAGEGCLEVVKQEIAVKHDAEKKPLPAVHMTETDSLIDISIGESSTSNEKGEMEPYPSYSRCEPYSKRAKLYGDALTFETGEEAMDGVDYQFLKVFTHPDSEWGFHILLLFYLQKKSGETADVRVECIEPIRLDVEKYGENGYRYLRDFTTKENVKGDWFWPGTYHLEAVKEKGGNY